MEGLRDEDWRERPRGGRFVWWGGGKHASGRPRGIACTSPLLSRPFAPSFILPSVRSITPPPPPSLPPSAFMSLLIIALMRLLPSVNLSESPSPRRRWPSPPRVSAWTGPREAAGRRRSIPDGQTSPGPSTTNRSRVDRRADRLSRPGMTEEPRRSPHVAPAAQTACGGRARWKTLMKRLTR